MSKWEEYKAKLGDTRPWDVLKPSTKQCKECGCIMSVKTKLKFAACPLEKW